MQRPNPGIAVGQLADYLPGAIGGIIVQHEDLKVGIILLQDGFHARADAFLLVSCRDQDGYHRIFTAARIGGHPLQKEEIGKADAEDGQQEEEDPIVVLGPTTRHFRPPVGLPAVGGAMVGGGEDASGRVSASRPALGVYDPYSDDLRSRPPEDEVGWKAGEAEQS